MRQPRRWPKIVAILSVGMLVLAGTLAGVGYYAWQSMLETGSYPSTHGFRIDGKAYRALQEAQKVKPGTHLVIQTQRSLVGPALYAETHLASTFDASKFVTLQTRGIPFEVERYLFEQRVLQPVISHRGDKPTTGYTVTFRAARPTSPLDH
jgi:hypothetical protein